MGWGCSGGAALRLAGPVLLQGPYMRTSEVKDTGSISQFHPLVVRVPPVTGRLQVSGPFPAARRLQTCSPAGPELCKEEVLWVL